MPKKRKILETEIASTSKSQAKRKHSMQDNSLKVLECEEENFLEIRPQYSIRSGKIISIHIMNFMCHTNLKIDFNSRVNMLIGQNGSGKSAILSALTVGLGAKARATDRCTTLKHLVQSGESSADIEITINNNGPDTYEPEQYGKYITICRHITASGASSYKIKNENGQIVTRKINDLNKLLLYMNIQTDNPVFVLNQDAARHFLRDMEPRKNYQFFLKATQIDTITQTLSNCGEMYLEQKREMICLQKELDKLQEDLQEINEKLERLQNTDKMKAEVKKHELERFWLKVTKTEETIELLNDNIQILQDECDKYQKLLTAKKIKENDHKLQVEKLEVEVTEKQNLIKTGNQKINQYKMELNRKNIDLSNEKYNEQRMKKKHQCFLDELKSLNDRIEERSQQQLLLVKKLKNANELELVKLRAEHQEIVAQLQQKKKDFAMLNLTKTRHEEKFESKKSTREKITHQIDDLKREVHALKITSKNQLSVYGSFMTNFLKDLEIAHAEGKFTKLPRGPLGRYVEVQNPKWRSTAEYLLKNLLKVFLVNSCEDQKPFDQIRSKYPDFKPVLIIMKFREKLYDISQGRVIPPPKTFLLLDEMKCSDTVVLNCLIDRAGVERILLCDNQNLAMHYASLIENVPKNLLKIILLKPHLEFYPAPRYRSYSIKYRNPRFLQTNLDEMKNEFEIKISNLLEEKTECETELRNCKTKLQEIYPDIERSKKHVENYADTDISLGVKIKQLEDIEYPEEKQIDFFLKEKACVEEKMKCLDIDIANIAIRITAMSDEKDLAEKIYKDFQKEFASYDGVLRKLLLNIEDIKSEIRHNQSNTKNWIVQINELTAEMNIEKDKLKKSLELIETYRKTASDAGERISTSHTDEELLGFIEGLNYTIEEILKTTESEEDLKAMSEDKQLQAEKNAALIETLSRNLELLKKSRLERFRHIMNLKHHMALRVKYTFDNVLKVKGFIGEISIDHKDQKLYIKIVPRHGQVQNSVTTTKALSGGERSYSTVAFLLALWACVDHPFYFLDEYDVFTDQVNREVMTKLLFTEADKKPHRQYVFLTPQNISFINSSPTISLHRLADRST